VIPGPECNGSCNLSPISDNRKSDLSPVAIRDSDMLPSPDMSTIGSSESRRNTWDSLARVASDPPIEACCLFGTFVLLERSVTGGEQLRSWSQLKCAQVRLLFIISCSLDDLRLF